VVGGPSDSGRLLLQAWGPSGGEVGMTDVA
jgi:hypothetical protein